MSTNRRKRADHSAYFPHRVAVLGIDTARISGWAVRISGRLASSGQLDTMRPELVLSVVRRAIDKARANNVRLLVALEAPFGGSVAVTAGLGAARERWRVALVAARHQQGRVLRVTPNEWRAAVLGPGWVGKRKRDEIRAYELTLACGETGLTREQLGADEAAAILISKWAAHAWRAADYLDRSERAPKPRKDP